MNRVGEMKELLIAEGALQLEGTRNIIGSLRKIKVENQILTIQELLEICSTLRSCHAVSSFLSKRKQQYPRLSVFTESLFVDKVVEYNIAQALDEQGFVKDSASKELKQIRRDLVAASEALRKKLESILRLVSDQDFLQETLNEPPCGETVKSVDCELERPTAL